MYYPIVHWHDKRKKVFREKEDFFKNYSKELDSLRERIMKGQLEKLFKKKAMKLYKVGDKTAKKILQASKTLSDDFNKDFEKAFSEFITFKPLSEHGLKVSDFENPNNNKKIVNTIMKYLQQVEEGYNSIAKFLQIDDIEDFFKVCAASNSTPELRDLLREKAINKKDKLTMISYNRFMKIDAAAQGILRSISKGFDTIKNINAGKFGNNVSTIMSQKIGDKNFGKFIVENINSGIRQVLGFGFEYFTEEVLKNKIQTWLGENAKVEHTGDKIYSSKFEYNRGTVDIKFSGELGKIKLAIPLGASMKLARLGSNDRYYLKVKESTTLGKMLDILENNFNLMDRKKYTAFVNIFANHSREDTEYRYEYPNMTKFNQVFNKALMVTGLAGSMTENDFATILILNDKFYSIYDIISNMFSNNWFNNMGISGGLNLSIVKAIGDKHKYEPPEGFYNQKAQKTRSEKINEALRSQTFDLKLSLSKNFLAKLLKS